ncbi:MAG: hypothetical protein B7Z63_06145, partial [Ignavibacteriae bacterium 37-53-5]
MSDEGIKNYSERNRSVKEFQPTVLVVDDDAKILFAFREVFKKEGYRSLVSHDGADALRMVAS